MPHAHRRRVTSAARKEMSNGLALSWFVRLTKTNQPERASPLVRHVVVPVTFIALAPRLDLRMGSH